MNITLGALIPYCKSLIFSCVMKIYLFELKKISDSMNIINRACQLVILIFFSIIIWSLNVMAPNDHLPDNSQTLTNLLLFVNTIIVIATSLEQLAIKV